MVRTWTQNVGTLSSPIWLCSGLSHCYVHIIYLFIWGCGGLLINKCRWKNREMKQWGVFVFSSVPGEANFLLQK